MRGVAATHLSCLFYAARVENMVDEMLTGIVIVSPLLACVAALRWATAEWLRAFEALARYMGKVL